ncbi:homolog to carboxyvinyl-carboxyphosphonate phosphorylmutase / homolog to isocitrate lyase (plasmid) [Natronomonas pharaonis DSM 2160]|uniref:Homolog to carboxyvinyl-carboxyphosphonate phosphorylmutase / homolog to isocitrate lyase n=1 Tax=Natronomonas pharaonis (strain ATCC 35678 / DSM 2160 / CIP 103997 / JCM 8858 / NBRC 14720 / NCIMB 2260 / Gabara) TaxID=348780 RepID=Q3ILY3_NATPD|nr:isocitrate lyase/PEP mutase family protein [Natronomonas pharaonis]CAI50886.1 homolog to carboxyvinyl-carboxyphosphonate phosphorylmutase / homolog to isocitrate lyase [Natronomonas pharaonis DSM 2160]
MTEYGRQLRKQLDGDDQLVCPGVHDPLTAAVADTVGFDAIYMTGYGTSLSATGYPDAGFITMPEMISNAANIQERISVPLVADADNGYGNATNVVRTVREYIKAGVGAIHIEDQTFPKRCGHTEGRQVIPREEAVGKIQAAAEVRTERAEEFVLIARTDARGTGDGSLEEAIIRANAFLDAGADVAFVEGPTDESELQRIGAEVEGPLLYNFVGDLGTSPYVDLGTLEELGFEMVIFPIAATLATIASVHQNLQAFAEDPVDAMRQIDTQFNEQDIGSLHEFSGFPEVIEWEQRYLPDEDREKYEGSLGDSIQ